MTLQAFEPTAPIMSVPVGSGQVERHGVSARSFDAARTRSLTPCCGAWLIRTYGAHAAEFYKEAFGAVELCRIESDDGEVFAEMSIRGARLFVAHESHAHNNFSPEALGGTTVRIDVLSNDPDGMQARRWQSGRRRSIRSARRTWVPGWVESGIHSATPS